MAHTLTTELSLVKPTSGTHEPYSITNENANLDTLDGLFNTSTGHDHSGAHKGAPVTRGTAMTVTSGLTVSTGGATITAGGLTVTAGNVGTGGAPLTNVGILSTGSPLTGINQYGFDANFTSTSGATSEVTGYAAVVATAAAAFTCTTVAGFHALNPTKGAGSTITNAYGYLGDSITTGNTNNYGGFINAPSG